MCIRDRTLNTYTELYTYTTLIFLRNHFRGNSKQKNMSLVEILENDEIMSSVFALMSLSVQTYMENKVLFEEDDIKSFICPTQLERTGIIVRYKRDNLHKPVYQFKHLILQEFFCSLSLSVTECVSPNPRNRELSSCAPVIYGIKRLLKEGENKLFISFFSKLLAINHFKKGTEYVEISYRNPIFKNFFTQNNIEIPDCMVKGDKLVINTSIPNCQEFLTLLFESEAMLECPFTSCKIVGMVSAIAVSYTHLTLPTILLV